MTSQYIQKASYNSDKHDEGEPQLKFSNISSQQMFPGNLPHFFETNQNILRMPLGVDDLPEPEPKQIVSQYKQADAALTFVNQDRGSLRSYFQKDDQSKRAVYKTPMMRDLNVPDDMVELRATDWS